MALISRHEALEILGFTERQLQRYSAKGKLSVHYTVNESGKKEARYNREEVRELAIQLRQTTLRPSLEVTKDDTFPDMSGDVSPLVPRSHSVALNLPSDTINHLRELLPIPAVLPPSELKEKPILTLREAAVLTGLPTARLRLAVRDGFLIGARIGNSWMVDTNDLVEFAKRLVRGEVPSPQKVGNG